MADFTPLGAMIKGPTPLSMGDMVNLARGVQAYQQAEQINPLAVQKAQQEAETGAINLGLLQRQDMERKNIATYLTDHSRYMKNGNYDLETMARDLSKIAPNTYQDVMGKYTELQKNKSAADAAKINLTEDQMAVITSPFMVHAYSGAKDKQTYIDALDKVLSRHKDNSSMQELGNAIKGNLSILKDGDALPGQVIKGVQEMMKPSTFAPTTQVTAEGKTTTIQPSIGGAPPVVTMGVAGGLQPSIQQPSVQPPPGMELRYPVRSGNQPYIPDPTEVEDQKLGNEYRNRLTQGQRDLATLIRNKDEVISQAGKIFESLYFEKGGKPADIERKIRQSFGSVEYDRLAKDLANLVLANAKVQGGAGGGTVAGLDMNQAAAGTIKVPPPVLIEIAQRVGSDLTRGDMEASGAQAFARKFGDNNMQVFQNAWNKNAKDSSKIFEAISIMNSIKNEKVLTEKFKELFPTAEERQQFAKRYKNLKSLAETGVTVSGD